MTDVTPPSPVDPADGTPVLVLLELDDDGALRPAVLEALTLARTVSGGAPVHAALPQPADEDDAEALGGLLPVLAGYGVTHVHRLLPDADPHLAAVLAESLVALREKVGASLLVMVSSFETKEVAARFAVATGAGAVNDADDVRVDGGVPVAHKTVFAGTWTTRCAITAPLGVVTIKASSVAASPAEAPTEVEVDELAVAVSDRARRVQLVERTPRAGSGRPDLGSAHVVVAGGRGTEGDFSAVEDLADALGGAVGATRVATDEGWIGHEAQIGQTGVTISPKLYIGAGISGAVHHRGGMQASGIIVAVNSDPESPIFEIADFGVVGDLFEVLPQAAAEIRRLREQA